MSEIIQAVKAGDDSTVSRILESDPTAAEARDESGVSVVLLALYHGKPAIAETIAARRSQLDLFEATALGRTDRVAAILEADAEAAHSFTPDGFPLVAYAAFFGRVDVLRLLLGRGVDPNARAANPMKVSAIHSAVANRDPQVAITLARLLLDAGAEPNARQQQGYTALHSAAMHGRRELVELLLSRGASAVIATDDGRAAADFARDAGHVDLARLLEVR